MSDIPKSQLYTRTGDSGESSLYNGDRKKKDDLTFIALGSLIKVFSSLEVRIE